MKILHMRKQWIPGPSFFFPVQSVSRASLRAKKRGTRDEASIIQQEEEILDDQSWCAVLGQTATGGGASHLQRNGEGSMSKMTAGLPTAKGY